MRSGRSAAALVVLGLVLLQAAWILALPAYRGIDEIDHVYRAAAVARGDWRPLGVATDGRGELLRVPDDIVRAARPQCRSLEYDGRANCDGARPRPDGTVLVASAAARYNPAYYLVVGGLARPFHGDAALYVMRAVSALMCALGLGAAAWCALLRRRTPWVGAGLVLALPPVLVYSTVVVAPNGPEMVAGLMMWTGLMGLGGRDAPGSRRCLACATVGASALVTLRSLGPVFAVCILLVVLVARRGMWADVVRVRPRAALAAGAVVVAALATSMVWIVALRPLGTTDFATSRIDPAAVARVVPLGLVQSVAAFPRRADPGPLFVYPVYLAALLVLLVAGVRAAARRPRRALVLGIVLSQALPLALTLAGARSVGVIWQGRYGLPFTGGVAVLAGIACDAAYGTAARRLPARRVSALAGVLGVAWTVVQVGCVLVLRHRELRRPATLANPGLERAPFAVVALLAVAGSVVLVAALLTSRRGAAAV